MANFWIVFAFFIVLVAWLDRKYCMLRDTTTVKTRQSYSWSRVQLAWWTVIILSSFITIFFSKGVAPTLHMSTVILLGISSATTVTAVAIDLSDQQQEISRHQNDFGKNFFLDILIRSIRSEHESSSDPGFQYGFWHLVYQCCTEQYAC